MCPLPRSSETNQFCKQFCNSAGNSLWPNSIWRLKSLLAYLAFDFPSLAYSWAWPWHQPWVCSDLWSGAWIILFSLGSSLLWPICEILKKNYIQTPYICHDTCPNGVCSKVSLQAWYKKCWGYYTQGNPFASAYGLCLNNSVFNLDLSTPKTKWQSNFNTNMCF